MKQTWLIVGLLINIALAGCLDGDSGSDDDPYFVEGCQVGTIDDDGVNIVHPHDRSVMPPTLEDGSVDTEAYDLWDASLTNFRTCTMQKVGYTELRDGDPHNYLGEIDMRGDLDLGAVAVLGNGEDPIIYLVDISDRADPQVLSTIEQSGTYIVDVKISDDGDYLFAASQNIPAAVCVPDTDNPASTCPPSVDPPVTQDGSASVANGFTIYDIRDRAEPVFVQTIASPDDLGCHMLSHQIIDGTDVVFCVGQSVHAHGLVRTTDGAPWAHLGAFTYGLPDGSGATSAGPNGCTNDNILIGNVAPDLFCSGPHDMTVAEDEVDGSIYMTVSHWDEGLRVVDVSNPVNEGFVTMARWDGEGATYYSGNVHTAMMFWVGDTRYVVATPELTGPGTVPSVWVLDATDLGDGSSIVDLPLVAEWYHPVEYRTPGLAFTTHQWQVAPTGSDVVVADVTIYITMNHLGVWALDFEQMLAGDLENAIGGFHMARPQLDREQEVGAAIYSTWDVNVVDGYIYGSDRATGLWVFDYTGDEGVNGLTGFA